MRKLPLAVQIWVVFTGIILGISLVLFILVPYTLRNFFVREIYATIETAQSTLLEEYPAPRLGERVPPAEWEPRRNLRMVNHLFLDEGGRVIMRGRMPLALVQEFQHTALAQQREVQRYAMVVQEEKILYVIRKVNLPNAPAYLVSYMWDAHGANLARTLFMRLLAIMAVVFLLSWVPSILLARYLSRPLVALENHVQRLADKDWDEPVRLDQNDEIGRLARSIERMRVQLVEQDKAQQALLQHISHELKTPVMVIASYAQSIRDGIYPKGDLPGTVRVIEDEASRLEKRIHDLLYMTKLDYLSTRKPVQEAVDLAGVIRDTVERLRWRRPELQWSINLVPAEVKGDPELWGVALENLLDNQIRFAAGRVEVAMSWQIIPGEPVHMMVRMWNDGPPIPPAELDTLFQPFWKGQNGGFGLGLAIVHRIAALQQARVWAANEDGGVAFYLEIPQRQEVSA